MSAQNDRLEEALAKTAEALADGFDADDVSVLVKEAVETAESIGHLDDLDGPGKRQLAIDFACALVDRFFVSTTPALEQLVEDLDWPLVPEAIEKAVLDPWVKRFAVPYARDLVKLAIPSLVDLVVDATTGKVAANTAEHRKL